MLQELKHNPLLQSAAADHYTDIAKAGLTSHKSSDGKTTYKERIERYAVWGGSIFEAILYGPEKPNPRDVVLAWVIDDGFPERTHRKNLFCPDHEEFALVAGPHATTDFCYISLFAAQIISKVHADKIEAQKRASKSIEYRRKLMQEKDWIKFAIDIYQL